jgi:hypothetical protein
MVGLPLGKKGTDHHPEKKAIKIMDINILKEIVDMSKTGEHYEELRELNNWDDADRHYEDEQVEKYYKEKKKKTKNTKKGV